MAIVGNGNATLTDLASQMDSNGRPARIIEILAKTNEIVDDMVFTEGNLPTGDKTVVRVGEPEPTWRRYNQGVVVGKGRTRQVTDTCGMLESESAVDRDLVKLHGDNGNAYRMSEARAHISSMGKELASKIIYGNADTDPEQIHGLAQRYSTLSNNADESGYNIVDAKGIGSDNTSIYLVTWGDDLIRGIYPKGSEAGLKHEDKGEQRVFDADGNAFYAFVDHFKWDVGLSVRNWKMGGRIANIDVSELTKDASAGADLVDLMTVLLEEKVEDINAGRAAFYCNRTIRSVMRRQIANKSNVNLSLDDFGGKRIMHFDGIPIRRVDAILNEEQRVI